MSQSKLSVLVETVYNGKGAKQAKDGIDGINKKAKESKGALSKMNDGLGNIEKSMVAIGAVGAVFKQAFELGKEGKQIEATEGRFSALALSIDSTSDALTGRLRQATQGSVTDLDLMREASNLMTMGLAGTEDEVFKMFDTVSKLKKPTDDMTEAMQNFSLMLANQSIARLDSFGISSGRVRTRINELMAANKDLDRETAFLTATMEEAEKTIERTGASAGAAVSSFERLEVKVGNAANNFKMWLGDGLEPWAAFLSGEYAQAIRDAIAANVELSDSVPDIPQFTALIEAWEKSRGVVGRLSGAMKEQNNQLTDIIVKYADFTGSNDELAQSVADLTGANVELDGAYIKINGSTLTTTNILRDLKDTSRELTEAEGSLTRSVERRAQAEEERTRVMLERATIESNAMSISREADRRSDAFSQRAIATTQRRTEQFIKMNREMGIATSTMEAFSDGMLTANRATESGVQQIHNYNQRMAEKAELDAIAAQRSAEIAERQRAYNAELGDFATEAMSTGVTAQERINELMLDSVGAFGASAEARVAVALATGQISEAQAEAMLKSALLQAEVTKLAEQYANGNISLNEYIDGVNGSIERLNEFSVTVNETTGAVNLVSEAQSGAANSAGTLGDKFGEADERGKELLGTLTELDGKNTISTHTTMFNQEGAPPSSFGGGATGGGVGNLGFDDGLPKRAGGGLVGIGKPHLVGEMGPEVFVPHSSGSIVPNNKIGGANNIVININTPMAATPQAVASVVSKRLGARG